MSSFFTVSLRGSHQNLPFRLADTSLLLRLLVALLVLGAPLASQAMETTVGFNRDIRPILAEACFHCHGPDPGSRKAGLRLDREDGVFAKRDDGEVVVKGAPEKSLLYRRLVSKDADEVMPPPDSHKELKPAQIVLVKRWIEQGAPWQPHWSFIKPERGALPQVRRSDWVRNPVDAFVLARLESAGLEPAPEANRAVLGRRSALDVTGLPPEPNALEEFMHDQRPDAYERWLDRLFASPRYGEHRARYWLDAARYADTHGLHFDNFRDIWPYRDWVISAFNKNVSFDRFTVEQLAGDLLPDATPEQRIATGFHRCNITTNEGGTIAEENLFNYARDRVETTAWVWLGLTANCAVCHDHKMDPITTKDFYSMTAFFRNTTQAALDGNIRDTAPVMVLPTDADKARWLAIPTLQAEANQRMQERRKSLGSAAEAWARAADMDQRETRVSSAGQVLRVALGEAQGTEVLVSRASSNETLRLSVEPVRDKDGKTGSRVVWDPAVKVEVGGVQLDGGKGFSVGFWLWPANERKAVQTVVSQRPAGPKTPGWAVDLETNHEVSFNIGEATSDNGLRVTTQRSGLKPGQWNYVLISYDGGGKAGGVRIGVNGGAPKTATRGECASHFGNVAPIRIGGEKGREFAGGSVQDFRVFARALPPRFGGLLQRASELESVILKAAAQRTPPEVAKLREFFLGSEVDQIADESLLADLDEEKREIQERSPVAYVQQERMDTKPMSAIYFRGQYDQPRDKVEPGVFSALHRYDAEKLPANRLGLARWIMDEENPLTARVTVNRFWQEVFGEGIVRTSEDFGIMGEAPSNQALLDWLAVEFRESGWDMRHVFRLMLTSSTYRQSAVADDAKLAKDLSNRMLSRGPRFRMDAEMVRDYALSVSGLLSERVGGASVKPYQPDGVWEAVSMGGNTRNYKRDAGEALYRRSMYTFWKRSAPPASMDIFNAPSRETSCVRRERTNTPLQALVTLNDPQFVEAARVLAANAWRDGSGDAGRVMDFLVKRTLHRSLSAAESTILKDALEKFTAHYGAHPQEAAALVSVGEQPKDQSVPPVAHAAWTMVTNQLLNLDEVLNK